MNEDTFRQLDSAGLIRLATELDVDPDLPLHKLITALRLQLGLPLYTQSKGRKEWKQKPLI